MNESEKRRPFKGLLMAAALMAALAVMIGAFGAHALKPMLEQTGRLATFETASRYHFYHSFALLLAPLLLPFGREPYLRAASWCFLGGLLVFSGSLYVLCLTGITWLGAITPLGGLLFIAGWLLMLLAIRKVPKTEEARP